MIIINMLIRLLNNMMFIIKTLIRMIIIKILITKLLNIMMFIIKILSLNCKIS